MISIARRKGIATTDRIGIAELAVATLDSHFTTTTIANNRLGGVLSLLLSSVDTTGALRVCALYSPIIAVSDNVAIVLYHKSLLAVDDLLEDFSLSTITGS